MVNDDYHGLKLADDRYQCLTRLLLDSESTMLVKIQSQHINSKNRFAPHDAAAWNSMMNYQPEHAEPRIFNSPACTINNLLTVILRTALAT